MKLTDEQKNAVSFDGNLLLTACPGSGKTRTIVAKLVQEVEKLEDGIKSIACITYTNTAVHEIESRISMHLNTKSSRRYQVSTIHSFCLRNILRPFSWRVPELGKDPRIINRDMREFEEIARYSAEKAGFRNMKAKDLEDFESLNVDASRTVIGPATKNNLVTQAAPHFWARCGELGFVDFCNIIYFSYCLLRDFPDISNSLSAKFAWFLVDEFQDTTELQTEIFKFIYKARRSKFFVVGDPYQSIYSFTGARAELICPFAEYIAAKTDIVLTGNFRSNPQIVSNADRLLARDPPMVSVGEYKDCIEKPKYVHDSCAVSAITQHFLPALQRLQIPLGEACILARDWGSLYTISRSLRGMGIPIVGPGARPYRRSRLFAQLAEHLCCSVDEPIRENLRRLDQALFQTLQNISNDTHTEERQFACRVAIVRMLKKAKELIDGRQAVAWLDSMSQFTGEILRDLGLINQTNSGLFYASVQEMKADMQRQKIDINGLTVENLGLFASPNKALRLATIHYAKGQEYSAVAIIGLNEGKIPHYYSEDIEDEKRLFYVALTRAKRILLYISEDNEWNNPASRFLGHDGLGFF